MAHTTDPFAPYEDHDSAGVAYAKAAFEKALAKSAHVRVETLRRALARVSADGYCGPISDSAWAAEDGRPMPMHRALAILRGAMEASLPALAFEHPDVGYLCDGGEQCWHPDHADCGEDGPMFHAEPQHIDRGDYLGWYFGAIWQIYGTWDLRSVRMPGEAA